LFPYSLTVIKNLNVFRNYSNHLRWSQSAINGNVAANQFIINLISNSFCLESLSGNNNDKVKLLSP